MSSLLLFVCLLSFGFSAGQKQLAETYKSGKVRLVQELMLDEKNLPKDVLLVGPAGIVCDPRGNVYVLDLSDNNIKKFDASGKFLKVIGRKGQGPGEFNMPTLLTFAKDKIVVYDMGNRRLCAFGTGGEFIKAENGTLYSGMIWGLKALPSGEIAVETEKIYFNEPNKRQDRFLEILTPELKPEKAIFSQPVLRNKYIRVQSRLTNIPQPFCPDVYWDVSPAGDIVVGFSAKYEINIFSGDGKQLATFSHPFDPVKVTAEDEKSFFDNMGTTTEAGITRGAPDYIIKNTTFPKFKPAFHALVVDSDGNILVQTYSKNVDEMNRYFDAFDSRGNFIARVHVEGRTEFPGYWQRPKFVDGGVWFTKYDSDGLPQVVKCRISE
jgi:hypothetical protein